MIRVWVAGVTGWTGTAVAAAVEAASDLELAAGVSRSDPGSFSSVAEALAAVEADVLVDYTHAEVVKENALAAIERGVAVVVVVERHVGGRLRRGRRRGARERHRRGRGRELLD